MTAPDPVRAGRALNGAAAAILVLEGLSVLFVPRGLAQSGGGLAGWQLTLVIVLAVLLLLSSGVMRRPRGLLIGTALQVPLVLTGFLGAAMWLVAGVFLLIWLYLLQVRKELLGSLFGSPPTG